MSWAINWDISIPPPEYSYLSDGSNIERTALLLAGFSPFKTCTSVGIVSPFA